MPGYEAVTVEIEYHDDNSFHTTYKVNKYPEYARKLEALISNHLNEEGIRPMVLMNPGPGKGYAPFWNCRNWFTCTKDAKKVRYPRLGSFEVAVKCPANFAAPNTGLPQKLEVWSKLTTHRWPDPEKLAQSVARLLAAGRDGMDVTDQVKEMKAQSGTPAKERAESRKPPRPKVPYPPMFFGLTPREHVPSPVVRLTPEMRGAESRNMLSLTNGSPSSPPRRPASATIRTSSGATLNVPPGRIRPSSASHSRSRATENREDLVHTKPASLPNHFVPQEPAPGPATSPDSEELHTFRASETPAPTPAAPDVLQASLVMDSKDDIPIDDDFEDEDDVPAAATPIRSTAETQELARRLVEKYGSSSAPADILKGKQLPNSSTSVDDKMLDLDGFKSQLYKLGVFSQPFNFGGLFKEIAVEERASLPMLAEALSEFWPKTPLPPSAPTAPSLPPAPTPPSLPPAAVPAPAILAQPAAPSRPSSPAKVGSQPTEKKVVEQDYDDYGDDFEESFEGPGKEVQRQEAREEIIEVEEDDEDLSPLHAETSIPQVTKEDKMDPEIEDDYEDEDFEDEAPPRATKPPSPDLREASASTVEVAARAKPEEKDYGYDDFESDDEEDLEEEIFAERVEEGGKDYDYAEDNNEISDDDYEEFEDESIKTAE